MNLKSIWVFYGANRLNIIINIYYFITVTLEHKLFVMVKNIFKLSWQPVLFISIINQLQCSYKNLIKKWYLFCSFSSILPEILCFQVKKLLNLWEKMLHIGSNFVTTHFAIYIIFFDRNFFCVNILHSILLCNQIFSMFA